MFDVRRDTIIKVGDILHDPSGKAYTVEKIDGYYFLMKESGSDSTVAASKWDLITEPWKLEVKDGRGYH